MAIGFYVVGMILIIFSLMEIFIEEIRTATRLISIIVGMCMITYTFITIHEPTAIDVYRGNTTLEITYKNGIPVDSTVVFK